MCMMSDDESDPECEASEKKLLTKTIPWRKPDVKTAFETLDSIFEASKVENTNRPRLKVARSISNTPTLLERPTLPNLQKFLV